SEDNSISVPGPMGFTCLEPCQAVQQLFPHYAPQAVTQPHGLEILSRLEMDVYRFTFRYQREKHELCFWQPREYAAQAIKIRETVHGMVLDKIGDPHNKYDKILNYLEGQYARLIKSNNNSQ